MSFLLEELQHRKEYNIKCAFSGSSAIIVQVTRGKNSWTFIDSYWLLKDKLANIAKWLGTEKGVYDTKIDELPEEEKKAWYANVDEYTLMLYLEQDCVILWNAVDAMQEVLWRLNGQMQRTLASSAMHLFRRRFLKQDIPTSPWVNDRAELAYSSSRVEVLDTFCDDAYYLDINSAFPYAMMKPLPGRCLGISRSIPDSGIYIAEVTVKVPDMWFPPLPTRIKSRLFFPTGTWRAWFSSVDIELLQEVGGKILSVHEVMHFESFTDGADYVTTLYEMRKNAETPFERTAFKFLLNMLYGKFAEGTVKAAITINPTAKDMDWMDKQMDKERDDTKKPEMITPGIWRYEKKVPVPHRHVPIAVHITAHARRTLYNYMAASEGVHYCDTDGFSSISPMPTTVELGGLKLEKLIRNGHFIAPKQYKLDGTELQKDGSWTELGDKGVKIKGFSRMTVDRWHKLVEGEAIIYERMYRVREQAARGFFSPGGHLLAKKLQNVVLPKRFQYPDGTTRPWDIIELRDYFKGNRKW
jgi:hypothetical protein